MYLLYVIYLYLLSINTIFQINIFHFTEKINLNNYWICHKMKNIPLLFNYMYISILFKLLIIIKNITLLVYQ